jgi:hypothetical protein
MDRRDFIKKATMAVCRRGGATATLQTMNMFMNFIR